MTMFRMPLAIWALFITAILLLLAVPVLSAAAAMLCDLNAARASSDRQAAASSSLRAPFVLRASGSLYPGLCRWPDL
jgi:hypothetical protein